MKRYFGDLSCFIHAPAHEAETDQPRTEERERCGFRDRARNIEGRYLTSSGMGNPNEFSDRKHAAKGDRPEQLVEKRTRALRIMDQGAGRRHAEFHIGRVHRLGEFDRSSRDTANG